MTGNKEAILVTGATGFIGSHLVPQLKKGGFEVIITPSSDKFDVRSKNQVLQLPPADIVIHLAGIANVPYSWEHPQEVMEINTLGTLNVLEYCVQNKARLVFPGSYAYGMPQYLPTDEAHPVKAENPYAVSKLAAESLCEVWQKRYGFGVTILRLFNVYGPGQLEEMVVPRMILGLIRNNKIEVFTGKPKRDMVFIDDVAEAFIAALKKKEGFNIYNVGYGRSWSVEEMARKLIETSGKKVKFIDEGIERPNDIMDTVADITKINNELGWSPKVSIDEGLEKTYSWFLNHHLTK